MGCLLALLAGVAPRVALALVWIFTNWVDRAFNGFLIPLLRLIIFPYATLFYVLAYNPVSGGLGGCGWIFVVLGFVFRHRALDRRRCDWSAALCGCIAPFTSDSGASPGDGNNGKPVQTQRSMLDGAGSWPPRT